MAASTIGIKALEVLLRDEQPLDDGSGDIGQIEITEDGNFVSLSVDEHRLVFTFHKDTDRLAFIFNWK